MVGWVLRGWFTCRFSPATPACGVNRCAATHCLRTFAFCVGVPCVTHCCCACHFGFCLHSTVCCLVFIRYHATTYLPAGPYLHACALRTAALPRHRAPCHGCTGFTPPVTCRWCSLYYHTLRDTIVAVSTHHIPQHYLFDYAHYHRHWFHEHYSSDTTEWSLPACILYAGLFMLTKQPHHHTTHTTVLRWVYCPATCQSPATAYTYAYHLPLHYYATCIYTLLSPPPTYTTTLVCYIPPTYYYCYYTPPTILPWFVLPMDYNTFPPHCTFVRFWFLHTTFILPRLIFPFPFIDFTTHRFLLRTFTCSAGFTVSEQLPFPIFPTCIPPTTLTLLLFTPTLPTTTLPILLPTPTTTLPTGPTTLPTVPATDRILLTLTVGNHCIVYYHIPLHLFITTFLPTYYFSYLIYSFFFYHHYYHHTSLTYIHS